MNDDRVVQIGSQSQVSDPLTELLRERAVELLQAAVNAECAEFLHRHQPMRGARAVCGGAQRVLAEALDSDRDWAVAGTSAAGA